MRRPPTGRLLSPQTISPAPSSDLYFAGAVKDGGLGKFLHRREPTSLDRQTVTRMNRDTLYSARGLRSRRRPRDDHPARRGQALHVDAGGGRGRLYAEVVYGPAPYTLSKTRSARATSSPPCASMSTPTIRRTSPRSSALQDAIKIEQPGGPGVFHVTNWDASSQVDVRTALIVLAETLPDAKGMFGPRGAVDPVRRLIGSGAAWGGIPGTRTPSISNVAPAQQRRQDRLQAHPQGRSGRRLLVDQRLRRRGPLRPQSAEGLSRSTASRRRPSPTARRSSSSAAATARSPTACRLRRTGAIWSASIAPKPEILNGAWSFPEPQAAR